MRAHERNLRSYLLDTGLVSRSDMEAALDRAAAHATSLYDALASVSNLSPDDLRRATARALGVPFIDLRRERLDFASLSLVPEPVSRRENAVAYRKHDGSVEVALLDLEAAERVAPFIEAIGSRMLVRLTDGDSIKSALREYQRSLKAEFGDSIREASAEIEAMGDNVPPDHVAAGRMLDGIARHALSQGASLVKIEQGQDALVVSYRIRREPHEAMSLSAKAAAPLISRIRAAAGLSPLGKGVPEKGGFTIEANGTKAHARVSFMPTVDGGDVAIRLSRSLSSGETLESLGFGDREIEAIERALSRPGLIAIAGADAQSLTRTLAGSVEDPSLSIVFIGAKAGQHMPRARRIEVDPRAGLGYPEAIRAAMRHGADVIVVSELADEDALAAAASAASVGKTVIASIHAPRAAQIPAKLVELGLDAPAVAKTLTLAIETRRARGLAAGASRRPLTKAELSALGKAVDLERILARLREERAIGARTGWDGIEFAMDDDAYGDAAIGIHETMLITHGLAGAIARGASTKEIEAEARREGMLTLIEDGIYKAALGLTTPEEALRAIAEGK